MPLLPSSRRWRRRGAVAAQVALCLAVLLGVAALAIDCALLMAERRHAQAAADAAALAAAVDLIRTPGNSSNTVAAVGAARQTASNVGSINYGYSDSSKTPNLTVTTNIPPTSGAFTDSSKYPNHVEVIVEWNQPRGFSAIWGSAPTPVRARAVARPDILSILTLSPTQTRGLDLAGTALQAPGKVIIDSTTSTALGDSVGGGSVTAQKVDVVGGNSLGSGAASPPPTTGVPSTADPLASLPLPSYGTYGGLPNPLPVGYSTSTFQYTAPANGSSTIYPGRYAKITVGPNARVTMSPGVYYLIGSASTSPPPTSMQIAGTLTGDEVLIYNGQWMGGTTNPTTVGKIQITNTAKVTLTPPTSGTWQGISIFQDRDALATMTLAGGSGTNISGLVYAAKAPVLAAGGGNVVPGSAFIVGSLVTGGGTLSLPVPSVRVPLLGASALLVE
jgi:Flp pilus assembly protein TadG